MESICELLDRTGFGTDDTPMRKGISPLKHFEVPSANAYYYFATFEQADDFCYCPLVIATFDGVHDAESLRVYIVSGIELCNALDEGRKIDLDQQVPSFRSDEALEFIRSNSYGLF